MLKTALPYLLAAVTLVNSTPGAKAPKAPPTNGMFEGDAIVVTGVASNNQTRIAVIIDTDRDGKANYSFIGQSASPAVVPIAGKLVSGARVVRDARSIRLYQDNVLVFWMGLDATPADPVGPSLVGVGGQDIERSEFDIGTAAQNAKVRDLITRVCGEGDEATCQGGGPGSSACSITCSTGLTRQCNATCGDGYYACCNCYTVLNVGAFCTCEEAS